MSRETHASAERADRWERWIAVLLGLGFAAAWAAGMTLPLSPAHAPVAGVAVATLGGLAFLSVRALAARAKSRDEGPAAAPRIEGASAPPSPGWLADVLHAALRRHPHREALQRDRQELIAAREALGEGRLECPGESLASAIARVCALADRPPPKPPGPPTPLDGETRRAYYGRALAYAGFAELASYLDAPGVLWNGTDPWHDGSKLWRAAGSAADAAGPGTA